MLLQLPNEDASVESKGVDGTVEYSIPAHWVGRYHIVSKCGWWMGEVCIVRIDGARYIDWLYAYSLKID
jgi:hypothetical protein